MSMNFDFEKGIVSAIDLRYDVYETLREHLDELESLSTNDVRELFSVLFHRNKLNLSRSGFAENVGCQKRDLNAFVFEGAPLPQEVTKKAILEYMESDYFSSPKS